MVTGVLFLKDKSDMFGHQCWATLWDIRGQQIPFSSLSILLLCCVWCWRYPKIWCISREGDEDERPRMTVTWRLSEGMEGSTGSHRNRATVQYWRVDRNWHFILHNIEGRTEVSKHSLTKEESSTISSINRKVSSWVHINTPDPATLKNMNFLFSF